MGKTAVSHVKLVLFNKAACQFVAGMADGKNILFADVADTPQRN
jgi:hypothetical protein